MPLVPVPGMPGFFYPGGMVEAEGGLYSDVAADGLTPSWVTWRGLLIAPMTDGNTPFHLRDIAGWDVTPQISFDDVAIAGGRGVAVTPGSMGPRVVTVTGWCNDKALRNQLVAMLKGYATPRVGSLLTEPLQVTHGGMTLSADAQLVKVDATAERGWAFGRFGFTIQWRCADPVLYGEQVTASTPIAVPTLGITFPVTGDWTFPADPVGGTVIVRNPGFVDSDAVYTLQGPLTGPGVAVIETGKWVDFDFDLGASDQLVIDTAAGICTLNGEYRSPSILSALLDEMRLPEVSTSTVQALGTPLPGSPSLSVAFRPAFW